MVRCVHTQEINLVFKDRLMRQFKTSEEMSAWQKLGINVVSGGLAGVLTDCFLYSFDFCRTQMATDLIGNNFVDFKRFFVDFERFFCRLWKLFFRAWNFLSNFLSFLPKVIKVFWYVNVFSNLFLTFHFDFSRRFYELFR